MRLDHLLSKEHWQLTTRKGVTVYSSFPGHPFLGDGASDCGTLTIRHAARLRDLVLRLSFGMGAWNESKVE